MAYKYKAEVNLHHDKWEYIECYSKRKLIRFLNKFAMGCNCTIWHGKRYLAGGIIGNCLDLFK